MMMLILPHGGKDLGNKYLKRLTGELSQGACVNTSVQR